VGPAGTRNASHRRWHSGAYVHLYRLPAPVGHPPAAEHGQADLSRGWLEQLVERPAQEPARVHGYLARRGRDGVAAHSRAGRVFREHSGPSSRYAACSPHNQAEAPERAAAAYTHAPGGSRRATAERRLDMRAAHRRAAETLLRSDGPTPVPAGRPTAMAPIPQQRRPVPPRCCHRLLVHRRGLATRQRSGDLAR
jgi:hypothetical protein